jgi:uncharacterized OsmC-like protein
VPPFAWSVRVSGAEGERASVFVRKQRFMVGAPASFDEKDPEVSALEYVLGAVGADLVNGLRAIARARRVPIDRAEALVRAEMDDPLAYLGVAGALGSPALSRVGVTVYVDSPAAPAEIEALWAEARARSPLARTLERSVALDLDLRIS